MFPAASTTATAIFVPPMSMPTARVFAARSAFGSMAEPTLIRAADSAKKHPACKEQRRRGAVVRRLVEA
jgi:hypothetical protein